MSFVYELRPVVLPFPFPGPSWYEWELCPDLAQGRIGAVFYNLVCVKEDLWASDAFETRSEYRPTLTPPVLPPHGSIRYARAVSR